MCERDHIDTPGAFLSITANIANLSNACEHVRSHIFPYSVAGNDPRTTPYCTWILRCRVKFECNVYSGIILSPFSYMALYHKELIRSLRTARCDVLISKVVLWIITTKALCLRYMVFSELRISKQFAFASSPSRLAPNCQTLSRLSYT